MNRKFSVRFLFSLSLLFLLCLSSCSLKAEQKSLTSQFEVVDALISQNQLPSALKELKKIEKNAFDSWSYIGIYKRYARLGQTNSAEKILKKALKKNSDNEELLAVYSNFLLRHNRLEDASKYTEKLRGTKYASLNSEVFLRNALASNLASGTSFYNDENFYQIYLDAYKGSRNPVWLRNCAVCNLVRGFYDAAVSIVPEAYADVDDAFFWALVQYDSGRFYECLDSAEKAKSLLKNYSDKSRFKTSDIQLAALESDSYMAVSDIEKSELSRRDIVMNLDSLTVRKDDEDTLPVLVLNSAIWARNQGLDERCADLLFYMVNRWENYTPSIILYSDFAYTSNLQRKEDDEILALRRAGISSLEMTEYDNRRKIPLSDAVYRIEKAYAVTKDPYLSIAKLDLHYKMNPEIASSEKTRDLWVILEDSYDENEKFKTLLVQYGLNFLLRTKQYEDAYHLFTRYIEDVNVVLLGTNEQDLFSWDSFVENLRLYDISIVEFAAWFAAYYHMRDEAIRLFEYCVYESGGILEEGFISPNVSIASCMNLAEIYVSEHQKDKALDLYGRAAGREARNSVRSEIFYRIARIYASQGDNKNALRSAEYASNLYPENARASLLKDKLSSH
ncbi:MAG: hypothetical protein J6J00_03115 [Treponema sp.]|nr:hypothetical protein [Treponema sp.]